MAFAPHGPGGSDVTPVTSSAEQTVEMGREHVQAGRPMLFAGIEHTQKVPDDM